MYYWMPLGGGRSVSDLAIREKDRRFHPRFKKSSFSFSNFNNIKLIIESAIQFHTRSFNFRTLVLGFCFSLREDSLDGSLFTRCSANRYKSLSRRSRTHNLPARYNRTRSSGYATGCAYARLHCRRSHLHAEDAPTRFQPHSPGCRCIQGLYCLLICSPFRLASVSMGIVVPFGTKCRSEYLRTERTLNEKLCCAFHRISRRRSFVKSVNTTYQIVMGRND